MIGPSLQDYQALPQGAHFVSAVTPDVGAPAGVFGLPAAAKTIYQSAMPGAGMMAPTQFVAAHTGTGAMPGPVVQQGQMVGALPTPGSSRESIANYIYAAALQRGYSPDDAMHIVAYAIGESGLSPTISGGPQGGAGAADEVIGLFQEKPAFAQAGGVDPAARYTTQGNVEAYLNQLAKHRGEGDIDQQLLATSVGGPMYTGGPAAMGPLVAQARGLVNPAALAAPQPGNVPLSQWAESLPARPGEEHLQPASAILRRAVFGAFPGVQEIGGWRESDPFPWHPTGRAIDIAIPNWDTPQGKAYGDQVYNWLMANADQFGIVKSGTLWQQPEHYNHIHVQLTGPMPGLNPAQNTALASSLASPNVRGMPAMLPAAPPVPVTTPLGFASGGFIDVGGGLSVIDLPVHADEQAQRETHTGRYNPRWADPNLGPGNFVPNVRLDTSMTETRPPFWQRLKELFGFAKGGATTDTVPAMLTPGEFVIRKEAVDRVGVDFLHALNAKHGFQQGGEVATAPAPLGPAVVPPATSIQPEPRWSTVEQIPSANPSPGTAFTPPTTPGASISAAATPAQQFAQGSVSNLATGLGGLLGALTTGGLLGPSGINDPWALHEPSLAEMGRTRDLQQWVQQVHPQSVVHDNSTDNSIHIYNPTVADPAGLQRAMQESMNARFYSVTGGLPPPSIGAP